jgi:transcriptional regulator with XRE-family HTH domain
MDTFACVHLDSYNNGMENNQMGNPVKDVRKALDLTQEEMARRLGCSKTSERRFEYTATLPRVTAVLANLRKLAKQAGVEIEAK